MRTTGTTTEAVYRFAVHWLAKNRPRQNPEAKRQGYSEQIYYVMVLFPAIYFLVSYFVFRLAFLAAIITAILWFISFFIAGVLYHRAIVSPANQATSNVPCLPRNSYNPK